MSQQDGFVELIGPSDAELKRNELLGVASRVFTASSGVVDPTKRAKAAVRDAKALIAAVDAECGVEDSDA